ncbi:unnamed protein product [Ixodes persulcatus]
MLGWLTWIIPLTVALAGVLSSSVWFISKRGKWHSNESGTVMEESTASQRGLPRNELAPQATSAATESNAGSAFLPRRGILKRIRLPSIDYSRVKDWAHATNTFKTEGTGRTNQKPDPMRIMWAQQAFSSMASPIYQSKLVRNLVTPLQSTFSKVRSPQPVASPRCRAQPENLVHRPPPAPCQSPLPEELELTSAKNWSAPATAVRPELCMMSHSILGITHSEDVSSFRSFTTRGEECVKITDRRECDEGAPGSRRPTLRVPSGVAQYTPLRSPSPMPYRYEASDSTGLYSEEERGPTGRRVKFAWQ